MRPRATRQDRADGLLRRLGGARSFSYDALARIAVGLSRLGVDRVDVVAMQLPNWWQFSLVLLACARLSALVNP